MRKTANHFGPGRKDLDIDLTAFSIDLPMDHIRHSAMNIHAVSVFSWEEDQDSQSDTLYDTRHNWILLKLLEISTLQNINNLKVPDSVAFYTIACANWANKRRNGCFLCSFNKTISWIAFRPGRKGTRASTLYFLAVLLSDASELTRNNYRLRIFGIRVRENKGKAGVSGFW